MENVYIYALIDPRNNHVRYIGKAKNPDERYKNHFNSARDRNTHKRNWINSVRKDGFRPELLILDEVPQDNWQWWESFYISLYKTYGFNLVNYTSGGDGATFANKGSFKKGNIPHNKGISPSEETKKKIRDNYTPNKGSYKKIIQYDLQYNIIDRYDCIVDAVRKSNNFFNTSQISSCCNGKRKHHRQFIWKFDDGSDVVKDDIVLWKKSVIQYNLNLIEINRFTSVKEASKESGILSGGIIRCCKGKDITSGGFIWKYDDDSKIFKKEDKQKKSVIQFNMNLIQLNIFESLTEAGNKTGINLKNISACCNGKCKTSGGFIWKFETK